jgi:hypothetical protein
VLLLDPTDGPLLVPAGAWDFGEGEVGWYLPLCRFTVELNPFPVPQPTVMTIQDGATFSPNVCLIDGALEIHYFGTTRPMLTYTPDSIYRTLNVRNGAMLHSVGGQPIARVDANATLFLNMMFGAVAATSGVFDVRGSLYCILAVYCRLADNSIVGNGTVFIQKAAQNAFFPGVGQFLGFTGTMNAFAPGVGTPYERPGTSPTVAENIAQGYFAGDTWLDSVAPAAWICVASTNVSATWLQIG